MYKTNGYFAHKFNIDGKDKTFYSKEKTKSAAWLDICSQKENYETTSHKQHNNFKMLADRMIEQQESTVRHKCIESYKTGLNHLEPFYDCDIQDIKPIQVQQLLDRMSKQRYSYSSVSKTKITFGLVLKYAILYENLNINDFMSVIKIPKNTPKGKIVAPGDDVIQRILESAETASFGLWALSLLCTGFRRGELDALQRKDIDFDNMQIPLYRSVEFVNNQPVLKDVPKSDSGVRKQPILDIYLPYLKKICEGLAPDDFLFGGEKPLTETQIKKRWAKYKKETGCNFNGHQLRHAYAFLLYRAGYDPKTMQHLLGHADFTTTMNIYTEFSKEVEQSKLKALNEYIEEKFTV